MAEQDQDARPEPQNAGDGQVVVREYVLTNLRWVLGGLALAAGIGSILPYLSQLLEIFQFTVLERLLVGASVVLLFVVVFLGKMIYDLLDDIERKRRRHDEELARLRGQVESDGGEVYSTFYGLTFSIFLQDINSASIDRNHYLTDSQTDMDLRGSTVTFTESFKGYNASEDPTEYIPLQITGDSPIDVGDTNFEANYKPAGNVEQEWKPLDGWEADQLGKFEILFKLNFPELLQPNEKFYVKYEAAFGEWPAENEQYLFIPQHRFSRGTDTFSARIHTDNLDFVEARKVTHNVSRTYFKSIEKLDFEIEEFPVDRSRTTSGTEISLFDEHTDALYLVRLVYQ